LKLKKRPQGGVIAKKMNKENRAFSEEIAEKKVENEFPNVLNLANRIFRLPLSSENFAEVPFSETVFGKIMLLREQTLAHPEALLQEGFTKVLKAFEKSLDDDMSRKDTDSIPANQEMLKKRNVFYNEYAEPVLLVADKIDLGKPVLRYQIKEDLKQEFSRRRDLAEESRSNS